MTYVRCTPYLNIPNKLNIRCNMVIIKIFYFQAFISTGFNVLLSFDPTPGFNPANRQADFEKEPGKVRLDLQNYLLKPISY